ncbi:MAG TPA: sugar phosphate isomerase/epimerase [Methanocella sp.]|nr:sugar phosphate isomerase/epimerase [Methanocella sp.]
MVAIGSKIDEVRVDGRLEQVRMDLKAYKKIGLKAAEIPVHGVDAIKNGRVDKRQTNKIVDLLRRFDFKYSVHAPNPLNLMDRESPRLHADVFRASLTFAEEIGAKILVYHPGRFLVEEEFPINMPLLYTEEEKQQLLDEEAFTIEQLARDFKGITICMENARPYLVHSPYCYAEQIGLLRDQVLRIGRSNVKITLDIGHLYMASKFYGFDPVEAAKSIAGLIAHTHVHDNFGGAIYHHQKTQTHQLPFGRGDSHMPVGWGNAPIRDILATYVDGYGGMYMMELRNRYFDHTEESRDNLECIMTTIYRKPKKGKIVVKEGAACSST